jgi:ribosomal protein L11 methyltransferase
MDYIEVSFTVNSDSTGTEILIAFLSQIGYESFMEDENSLKAYIPANHFKPDELNDVAYGQAFDQPISYSHKLVKSQNWNEVWESNFNPVTIRDEVYIRAPFHPENRSVKFDIIIEPKMSFGTAHHETTSMMIELMLDENFAGHSVLDMGCGTGILAILSEMLGAKTVMAIDIDNWAHENAIENIRKNKCQKINVLMGNVSLLKSEKFDFILANINRNVLLEDMVDYGKHLNSGGVLLLSGFYTEDLELISTSATDHRFKADKHITKNNWVGARFIKSIR